MQWLTESVKYYTISIYIYTHTLQGIYIYIYVYLFKIRELMWADLEVRQTGQGLMMSLSSALGKFFWRRANPNWEGRQVSVCRLNPDIGKGNLNVCILKDPAVMTGLNSGSHMHRHVCSIQQAHLSMSFVSMDSSIYGWE